MVGLVADAFGPLSRPAPASSRRSKSKKAEVGGSNGLGSKSVQHRATPRHREARSECDQGTERQTLALEALCHLGHPLCHEVSTKLPKPSVGQKTQRFAKQVEANQSLGRAIPTVSQGQKPQDSQPPSLPSIRPATSDRWSGNTLPMVGINLCNQVDSAPATFF